MRRQPRHRSGRTLTITRLGASPDGPPSGGARRAVVRRCALVAALSAARRRVGPRGAMPTPRLGFTVSALDLTDVPLAHATPRAVLTPHELTRRTTLASPLPGPQPRPRDSPPDCQPVLAAHLGIPWIRSCPRRPVGGPPGSGVAPPRCCRGRPSSPGPCRNWSGAPTATRRSGRRRCGRGECFAVAQPAGGHQPNHGGKACGPQRGVSLPAALMSPVTSAVLNS